MTVKPPTKRATRYRDKPVSSPERRLIMLAKRQNLAVGFDREIERMRGPWIAIADPTGRVLHESTSLDRAGAWLAQFDSRANRPSSDIKSPAR